MEIRELATKARLDMLAKGYTGETHVPTKLALIHSEVSEALDCHRNGEDALMYERDKNGIAKPVGLPSELADIIIRTLDLAARLDIDIQAVIEEKMEYNLTRTDYSTKRY